jgi:hypothetical protein
MIGQPNASIEQKSWVTRSLPLPRFHNAKLLKEFGAIKYRTQRGWFARAAGEPASLGSGFYYV